jgi:hypothetical protein
MKADPILKELWEIKDGLAAECDYDLRRLFDRLKASQKDRGLRLVNRTKRQPTSDGAACPAGKGVSKESFGCAERLGP